MLGFSKHAFFNLPETPLNSYFLNKTPWSLDFITIFD